ncbi:MAG: flavodoxin domain-containing protein [Minwuia sp.]|nr:flavodoxin domain-containing protein [Minwuia sp.]
MSASINILVGSMTGTAEMVAEDMQAKIEEVSDHPVEMMLMDDLDASVFDRDGVFLIVTSTYGQGEVPDNALDFYEAIDESTPDLSGVRFGVFGLGDSTYGETYNFGGKLFEDLLTRCGARIIGERSQHNANGAELPEEAGVVWIQEWIRLIDDTDVAA